MTFLRLRRRAAVLLIVTVAGAISLSRPFQTVAAQGPVAQRDKRPLTNADIVRMIKGGFSDSVIVSAIQASETRFDVSLDTLFTLKEAGVGQRIIEAMQAAEARSSAPSAAPQQTAGPQVQSTRAPSGAIPPANIRQPYAAVLQSGTAQLLSPSGARGALTNARGQTLASLAADPTVNDRMASSVATDALINDVVSHPVSTDEGLLGLPANISTIKNNVGRLLGRKPKYAAIFALQNRTSSIPVQTSGCRFEVVFGDVPGINPDDYEPVIIKLAPTANNWRLYGTAKVKDSRIQYSDFTEERIPSQLSRVGRGRTQLIPAAPLAAGEYGIVLRPVSKAAQPSLMDGSGKSFYLTVWDFSIAPAEDQAGVASQPAPEAPPSPSLTPKPSPTPREPNREPAAPTAVQKLPAGSAVFQTTASYDAAYDGILDVLKKEGYTIAAASKETGQVTTELAIEHGAVDIGRGFIISLFKEAGSLVTVQVVGYKQGRRIGGQWQTRVYTKDKAWTLAEKIRAALGVHNTR